MEKRESFERLAEKMRATDYWRVSFHMDTNVEVTPAAEMPGDQFILLDDPEWHELLADVDMFMVFQSDDGAVWIDPGVLWSQHENQMGHNGFTHNPNMLDEFIACQPEHERIPCGRCAVAIEYDWYIHYIWYPQYFSKEEWDGYLNGATSLDEYSESRNKVLRQCNIDGYTEMGYDVNKIFNLEEN